MSIWNNAAAVDLLHTYVTMRIPYPDIASRLGTTTGSVCAKVSRLGIGLGPKTQQTTYRKKEGSAFAISDPYYLEIARGLRQEAKQREGSTVHLDEADADQCTFVIGEPKHRQVCGHARREGSSYCEHHYQRCKGKPRVISGAGREAFRQVGIRNFSHLFPRGYHGTNRIITTVDRLPFDARSLDLIDGAYDRVAETFA